MAQPRPYHREVNDRYLSASWVHAVVLSRSRPRGAAVREDKSRPATHRSPWTWLVLYVALVYASSPFTPALVQALKANASGRALLTVVPLLAVVALVPIAVRLGQARRGRVRIVPLLAIVALYAAVWSGLCRGAVEAVHLSQYGLMSILALRALRDMVSVPIAYGGGVLLTVAASWGNELIQSVLPNRVYDLRDVALDGLSALLAVMVVWQVERS